MDELTEDQYIQSMMEEEPEYPKKGTKMPTYEVAITEISGSVIRILLKGREAWIVKGKARKMLYELGVIHADLRIQEQNTATTIFTNDIKKGERCRLRNGWEAVMEDNRKGWTRTMTVEGDFTEAGSVYAHDIMEVQREGKWLPITHTLKQLECYAEIG
jgi:hypothetical protein